MIPIATVTRSHCRTIAIPQSRRFSILQHLRFVDGRAGSSSIGRNDRDGVAERRRFARDGELSDVVPIGDR